MNVKRFVIVMLLLATCLHFVGCRQIIASVDQSTGEVPSQTSPKTDDEAPVKVKYIYKTKYVDFAFLSDDQKAAWKEPLVNLLNNQKYRVYAPGGDLIGYSYLYPDRPCIEIGYELALLDINTDGTPELLVNTGGGSSGNACYCVYDIITGEEIGTLDGGHEYSWCMYFNHTTGMYEAIGQFEWRSGWMGKYRIINKAAIGTTRAWGETVLHETHWIGAYYSIDVVELELTEEEKETGYHASLKEIYPEVIFWVNGDQASIETYFSALDDLTENYLRIAATGIQLIGWSDVSSDEDDVATRAEKMAEALISSDQKFLQPLPKG